MSKRRARYSAEFKQDAFSRMGQRGKTVTALAGGVRCWAEVFILVARTVAGWRQGGAFRARQGKAARGANRNQFPHSQPSVQLELRIAELSAARPQASGTGIFFKRTFEHVREQPRRIA